MDQEKFTNAVLYLLERASGKPYGEFLNEAIFGPLGMSDTGHDGDAQALVSDRASGYVPAGLKGFGNAVPFDWSTKTGNGSLYSTTADLLKFDQALYIVQARHGCVLVGDRLHRPRVERPQAAVLGQGIDGSNSILGVGRLVVRDLLEDCNPVFE